jgi:UDP-glucose-4-epimerase GalE
VRILVTGGAGYIGSHTIRCLRSAGHEPVVYDNLSTGHREAVNGFDCIIGEIADRERLAEALRGVEAVMHFAADSCVAESLRDQRKYFENNVRGGLGLLHSMLDSGVRRFVLSSTCAVYGLPTRIPIPEDCPRDPVNAYGASKLALEHALEAYSGAYDLRYVSLRYFNAAGADESAEIGELHQPETHLIPCALEAAAGGRREIDIFGTDYPTPDGTCIRDYIHVNDLAEAHVRALDYLLGGGESTAINLGTGKGQSVLEVLGVVEEITGRTLPRRLCPRRAGDPPRLVADATRARQQLRWSPSRSLHQMVGTAWNWMQAWRRVPAGTTAAAPREAELSP